MQPLNSPQKEAVETTEGPLLVLAGAGTGKTKVLTSRIAYIISNNLAYPSQILAVTFSNKAAKEMQNRINDITASDGLNIGTFHSISTRILRSHIHLLDNGMNRNFNIIDQDEQIKLVKNIALENNIDIKKYPLNYCMLLSLNGKIKGLYLKRLAALILPPMNHNLPILSIKNIKKSYRNPMLPTLVICYYIAINYLSIILKYLNITKINLNIF